MCEKYSIVLKRGFLIIIAGFIFSGCAAEPPPPEEEVPGPRIEEGEEPVPEKEEEPEEEEEPVPPPVFQILEPGQAAVIEDVPIEVAFLIEEGRTPAEAEVRLFKDDPEGREEAIAEYSFRAQEEFLSIERRSDETEGVFKGGSAYRLSVSVEELVNGETYTFQMRLKGDDSSFSDWSESVSFRLAVDIAVPVIVNPPQDSVSIDRRPLLSWTPVDRARSYDLLLAEAADGETVLEETKISTSDYQISTDLDLTQYSWSLRYQRDDGLISSWYGPFRFSVTDKSIAAGLRFRDGEVCFDPSPQIDWTELQGAATYHIQIATEREPFEESIVYENDSLLSASLSIPQELDDGTRLFWRFRGISDDNEKAAWTNVFSFVHKDLGLEFADIVLPGESALFSMGSREGRSDEEPVHEVILRRPYAMSIYEMSNDQAAAVANWGLNRGLLEKDGDFIIYRETGHRIIGLGDLNYGIQFGLLWDGERIVPAEGREDHPLIGFTWYGAVACCNLLSHHFARDPVYDFDEESADFNKNGFRLPSEAEWEYAARSENSLDYPWNGGLSRARVNYYRSFDPFEAVSPPFTQNGGPCTPVGFFSGGVELGFQTGSNASPFGVFDLIGNVWEWCNDWYDEDYYAASPEENPLGPPEGDLRVVRGCAWNSRVEDVRTGNRGYYDPAKLSYSIGLRLVYTIAD